MDIRSIFFILLLFVKSSMFMELCLSYAPSLCLDELITNKKIKEAFESDDILSDSFISYTILSPSDYLKVYNDKTFFIDTFSIVINSQVLLKFIKSILYATHTSNKNEMAQLVCSNLDKWTQIDHKFWFLFGNDLISDLDTINDELNCNENLIYQPLMEIEFNDLVSNITAAKPRSRDLTNLLVTTIKKYPAFGYVFDQLFVEQIKKCYKDLGIVAPIYDGAISDGINFDTMIYFCHQFERKPRNVYKLKEVNVDCKQEKRVKRGLGFFHGIKLSNPTKIVENIAQVTEKSTTGIIEEDTKKEHRVLRRRKRNNLPGVLNALKLAEDFLKEINSVSKLKLSHHPAAIELRRQLSPLSWRTLSNVLGFLQLRFKSLQHLAKDVDFSNAGELQCFMDNGRCAIHSPDIFHAIYGLFNFKDTITFLPRSSASLKDTLGWFIIQLQKNVPNSRLIKFFEKVYPTKIHAFTTGAYSSFLKDEYALAHLLIQDATFVEKVIKIVLLENI